MMRSTPTAQPAASAFVHAAPQRRRFPRRSKPFQGVYFTAPGTRIPTVGLDASGGGLCMLLQQPLEIGSGDVTIMAVIDEKPLSVVGHLRWADTLQHRGATHYRYGLAISSIADQDWDRLMHWTVQNSDGTIHEGSILSASQRDSMITTATQRQIARALVENHRLESHTDDRLPLIEYKFEKYTMRMAIPYMLVHVRSKATDPIKREITEFRTQILVPCDNGMIKLLD